MAKNDSIVKLTAPLGISAWPKLTEPDYGTKAYPKPDGEYSVKMIWDESDADFVAFREQVEAYLPAVEAMANEKFAELKKPQRDKLGAPSLNAPFVPVYEGDDPTGQVEAKFSMKAGGIIKKGARAGQKWSRSPALFDAFGRPLKKKVQIWGGSELVIAFSFMKDGYFIPATGAYGIKLQLEAAQVVTLRSGGEQSASAFGFGKHDGGFDVGAVEVDDEGAGDDDSDLNDEDDDIEDGDY
jgi:hypothetical protein